MLGPDGARLAKRHGDVTLREVPPDDALAWMAGSLGMRGRTATELLAEFDPAALPRDDTTLPRGPRLHPTHIRGLTLYGSEVK